MLVSSKVYLDKKLLKIYIVLIFCYLNLLFLYPQILQINFCYL